MQDTRLPRLSPSQFRRVRKLVHELCGIDLIPGKELLVQTRLAKRLRALGLRSFDEYLRWVERDTTGRELLELVDAITTNETYFFRESQHFEYLRTSVLPALRRRGLPIRIWSAGCSTGEEPFTIAMVLREELTEAECAAARILATDISRRALAKARAAVYTESEVRRIPPRLLRTYFTCISAGPPRRYQARESIRSMVRLARLNLIDPWPMKGPFDVIFCRNVMIYFDKQTQQRLVERFWELLRPGGHLFVGHSESLSALSHRFGYRRPAVYVK